MKIRSNGKRPEAKLIFSDVVKNVCKKYKQRSFRQNTNVIN